MALNFNINVILKNYDEIIIESCRNDLIME